MEYGHYMTACEQAARTGGRVLLDWATRFRSREKGPADLVTDADLASQEAIRQQLLSQFPDHAFLGEEGEFSSPTEGWEYRWVVDPLDGTANYVHGLPHYCVSVALQRGEEILCGAVYQPRTEECYTAVRGGGAFLNRAPITVSEIHALSNALVAASFSPRVARDSPQTRQFVEVLLASQSVRRFGSAALNLAYLAAGRVDGYWATDTKLWDVAAGLLLVQEAGGVVTGIEGQAVDLQRPLFVAASTVQLHRELLQLLALAAEPGHKESA